MIRKPLVKTAAVDLKEVVRKLDEVSTKDTGLSLRPPSSVGDRDSGLSSRSLSNSSFDYHPDNFAPMEKISEIGSSPGSDESGNRPTLTGESGFEAIAESERPLSPTIGVEEVALEETMESKLIGKLSPPESCHHLNIPLLPRKDSSGSNTSSEYVTPPTSRKLSTASSASSSSSPQEVRIKVQINFPVSNREIVVNSSAKVHRHLKQLQFNFFFTPNMPRRCSSPASTPNSPTPKEKMKLNSKSLDRPDLPCTDKTSRRSRNNLIAGIVRRNMVEFVDSTDIDSLCPHLYANELLSRKDMEDLEGIKSIRGKKNLLYMLLMDSKGVDAYQKLFECLENETQHCGHRDLVKIIEYELKKRPK